MLYWLPFFSKSSRYDVEIVMEMVALIQEYPECPYKGTFYLAVISPLMFSFWPNKTRGSLATPEKRRTESHSMP